MSDTLSIDPAPVSHEVANPLDKYRSQPKQLARWLLESRDTLREKYQGLKVEARRLKVRVSDSPRVGTTGGSKQKLPHDKCERCKPKWNDSLPCWNSQRTAARSKKKVNSHPVR